MNIKPLHPNFKLPVRSTEFAGAYDIFMPESGFIPARAESAYEYPLGFSANVPKGHVALILPRSGKGAKDGLALNNTCGVIDSDYTGEWKAFLRIHDSLDFFWQSGERLLQFLIVPVFTPELQIVETLESFDRTGGFGSTGK